MIKVWALLIYLFEWTKKGVVFRLVSLTALFSEQGFGELTLQVLSLAHCPAKIDSCFGGYERIQKNSYVSYHSAMLLCALITEVSISMGWYLIPLSSSVSSKEPTTYRASCLSAIEHTHWKHQQVRRTSECSKTLLVLPRSESVKRIGLYYLERRELQDHLALLSIDLKQEKID